MGDGGTADVSVPRSDPPVKAGAVERKRFGGWLEPDDEEDEGGMAIYGVFRIVLLEAFLAKGIEEESERR
jgi:hypothetical protein